MVLSELGAKLTGALAHLSSAAVVDDGVVDAVLKDIVNALVRADVDIKLASELRKRIKDAVAANAGAAGINKQRVVQKVRAQCETAAWAGGVTLPPRTRSLACAVCCEYCVARLFCNRCRETHFDAFVRDPSCSIRPNPLFA